MSKGKKTVEALLIGQRVKAARKSKGLTLEQMAFELKILPSTLGNYEQGTRKLPTSIAKGIQKVTGVPAAYVMALVDEADRDILMAPETSRIALLHAIRSFNTR